MNQWWAWIRGARFASAVHESAAASPLPPPLGSAGQGEAEGLAKPIDRPAVALRDLDVKELLCILCVSQTRPMPKRIWLSSKKFRGISTQASNLSLAALLGFRIHGFLSRATR